MSNEYYIISGQSYAGPYELVALVIKIRNGTLSPTAHIQRVDSHEVKLAQEWDELKDFFNPGASTEKKHVPNKQLKKLNLIECLKDGFAFLNQNQISIVFSGIFILFTVLMTVVVNLILPDEAHVFGYIIGFISLHFLLSCYMFLILRMTRGQVTDVEQLVKKISPAAFRLLRSSLMISFPIIVGIILFTFFEDDLLTSLLGLLIIIIPGIYVITIFSFAPLLIIDRGAGAWEALETSRSAVMKGGLENFGVYFALNMINLIAGLCMIFPMAITLPVTMSNITESYDELLS